MKGQKTELEVRPGKEVGSVHPINLSCQGPLDSGHWDTVLHIRVRKNLPQKGEGDTVE